MKCNKENKRSQMRKNMFANRSAIQITFDLLTFNPQFSMGQCLYFCLFYTVDKYQYMIS